MKKGKIKSEVYKHKASGLDAVELNLDSGVVIPAQFSAESKLRHRLRSARWLDTQLSQMIPGVWNESVLLPDKSSSAT